MNGSDADEKLFSKDFKWFVIWYDCCWLTVISSSFMTAFAEFKLPNNGFSYGHIELESFFLEKNTELITKEQQQNQDKFRM